METKRIEHHFQRKTEIHEGEFHQRNLKRSTDVRFGRKTRVKTEFDRLKRKTYISWRDIDLPILKSVVA
jgi:hypothetical protein